MALGHERRFRQRVLTNRVVSCRSMLATGTRAPFSAETIDVSSNGVGLLVDVPLRGGTPLTVELRFDDAKLDLTLDGVVMHAVPAGRRTLVGVRFVGLALAAEAELKRFVTQEDRRLRASGDWREPIGPAGRRPRDHRGHLGLLPPIAAAS
jgi:hypothetical protein